MPKGVPFTSYRQLLMQLLRMDIDIERAEGDWLFQAKGEKKYDSVSQFGTNIFGHNHPEIIQSVTQYLQKKKPNFIQPLQNDSALQLGKMLVQHNQLNLSHFVYANSGAEAVEAAIKLARLGSRKTKILSLRQSFHGKTYASLSASGSNRHRKKGLHDSDNYISIQLGDLDALESQLSLGDIAGFIYEPVQGEGGMTKVNVNFLLKSIALCKKYNALVIADEIQTGLGRCGQLIISEELGYTPDIVCLGKGLSGGIIPISIVLYSKKAYTTFFDKKHSSTFAGGGIATEVGLNVLKILTRNQDIYNNVATLSLYIDKRAAQLEKISEGKVSLTGMGLMRAVHLDLMHSNLNYLCTFLYNSGFMAYLVCSYLMDKDDILAMPLLSKNCSIRFEPALNTTIENVKKYFDALDNVIKLLNRSRYDILMAHLVNIEVSTLPDPDIYFEEYNSADFRSVTPVALNSDTEFDFVFFSHITSKEGILKSYPQSILLNYTVEQQLNVADIFIAASHVDPSPEVTFSFDVTAKKNTKRGAILLSLLEPSSMMKLPPLEKLDLIDEFAEKAKSLGANIAGLGAYTSVITRAGVDIENRYDHLSLTTGNSLTAASTISQYKGTILTHGCGVTAIFGARGSVGRLIVLALSYDVSRLLLVGKKGANINRYKKYLVGVVRGIVQLGKRGQKTSVANQILDYIVANKVNIENQAEIEDVVEHFCSSNHTSKKLLIVSDEHDAVLKISDYIISCTSEGKPFLNTAFLKKTAIAFDAARPFDFIIGKNNKPIVIEAGLVEQPFQVRYGDCNMQVEQTGMMLGCFTETIVLAMEGVSKNYSIGKEIPYSEYETIRTMSIKHGFRLPSGIPGASK